jgi:hypothetical protein
MPFKWRCNRLDWDGPWSWRGVQIILALSDIVPKLHDFESMNWGDIEGKTGSHFVKVSDLCNEARDRLTTMDEDADSLFSLRLTNKMRIWGIRDLAIFRLIWWDPEHSVCPSLKKNT